MPGMKEISELRLKFDRDRLRWVSEQQNAGLLDASEWKTFVPVFPLLEHPLDSAWTELQRLAEKEAANHPFPYFDLCAKALAFGGYWAKKALERASELGTLTEQQLSEVGDESYRNLLVKVREIAISHPAKELRDRARQTLKTLKIPWSQAL